MEKVVNRRKERREGTENKSRGNRGVVIKGKGREERMKGKGKKREDIRREKEGRQGEKRVERRKK